jgi:hypothetical protein
MTREFRFAAHVLMFNCDKLIMRMIENCAPFVEKIYVAYSPMPWSYNPAARERFPNRTDKEILRQSKYFHKIELIEGTWDFDEDQRNACLERAKAAGFDYLIIQDADEFYHIEDYRNNIEEIKRHDDWEVFCTPWYCFWKNLDYVVIDRKGSAIVGFPEFAINLRLDGVRFIRARIPNLQRRWHLPGVCYHLSYVLTDEEVLTKIHTWGHADQFDRQKWFERKWLKWNQKTENLHPIEPPAWKKAVPFKGTLPEALERFESPSVVPYRESCGDMMQRWSEKFCSSRTPAAMRQVFSSIRRRLKIR